MKLLTSYCFRENIENDIAESSLSCEKTFVERIVSYFIYFCLCICFFNLVGR